MAHRMANFTIQAMLHLVINEFTQPEREQKLGVMVSYVLFNYFLSFFFKTHIQLWPEWHFGVLLLYGGHLAINHLTASGKF